MTENDPKLPPGLALAWGVTPGPRRGPKPAHTVDDVVRAGIEVADADGFGAVSMPRIARHLGLTPNALYRYVRSRDELLVLLADTAWGPPPDSVAKTGNWREAMTVWTHAFLDRLGVHPWLLDVPVRGAPSTPNLLGWAEVFLDGVADSGLSAADALGAAMLLDNYARGTAALDRDLRQQAPPLAQPEVLEFLLPRMAERGLPVMASVYGGGGYDDAELPDADVEFGLNRILDGIQALVDRT
ncbi:TetR/AcrR family transcriptional regulator [Amycolatopsis minnesotensis]|uniref:TetR/AcrR family transcriptional regulator n=1 Tax=Amycolatopsis minnesotensis TaxID=337894 RepID=A0ABP5C5L3_9PSEU